MELETASGCFLSSWGLPWVQWEKESPLRRKRWRQADRIAEYRRESLMRGDPGSSSFCPKSSQASSPFLEPTILLLNASASHLESVIAAQSPDGYWEWAHEVMRTLDAQEVGSLWPDQLPDSRVSSCGMLFNMPALSSKAQVWLCPALAYPSVAGPCS